MSDSQAYEEIAISSEGVSVVKRFEEDEFPVPAIAFEFTSHRDEQVHIVLSDTVPEDIEVEDLGFHPEYGSEYWVIDDDNNIAFERDLGVEETYTTVYGIRATGSDNVEKFLTEPQLETVNPPLPDETTAESVVPESEDEIIKDAITGDGEIPGLTDDDDDEEDVEKLDLKDPTDPGNGTSTATTDERPTADEGVVAAMAAEIRQQNVSVEDVKLLRQAFAGGDTGDGATAAKVDQIQDDVADLRAYTNALEEFLDENGTAQQLLGEFETRIDSFESQLSSLESAVDSNTEQVTAVTETVEGFESDIQTLDDEVVSVREEMDSLGGEVESVSADIEEVSGELSSLDEELSEFEADVQRVQSDVEELEQALDNGDLAARLDDIEDSLDDLEAWQEQIKSTFGG